MAIARPGMDPFCQTMGINTTGDHRYLMFSHEGATRRGCDDARAACLGDCRAIDQGGHPLRLCRKSCTDISLGTDPAPVGIGQITRFTLYLVVHSAHNTTC